MKTMILTILMLTVSCGGDGSGGLVMQDDGVLGAARRSVPVSDAVVTRDDGSVSQVRPLDAMAPAPDATAPGPDTAQVCMPTPEICDGKDNDCDGVIDTGGVCVYDSIANAGHTYLFMGAFVLTWDLARTFCQDIGYDLASIETAEEWAWLDPWLVGHAGGVPVWIGLQRESEMAPWVWVSGAPVDFTVWQDGQPNNSVGNENCVDARMLPSQIYVWSDRPCDGFMSAEVYVLCEAGS